MTGILRPKAPRWPTGYGAAERAVIAPAACGGFVLLVKFTRTGPRETGVDLGLRCDEYDLPNAAEVAAADTGLTRLGLRRTGPWLPGTVHGSLTAPVIPLPDAPRKAARLCAALAHLISREVTSR